jgi:glycosyltransferase involved in cell wall biosynthesis
VRPAPAVSIVIPAHNEGQSLPILCEALLSVLRGLPRSSEVILVDDGSSDGTPALLRDLGRRHRGAPGLICLRLQRQAGKSAALRAGFGRARGEVLVTLDGDLQNDPADIPPLLDLLAQGHDLVMGWRRAREDGYLERHLPSLLANRLLRLATGVPVHDVGCGILALRREVLPRLPLYPAMHRYLPVLAACCGAHVTELPVRHHPRRFGRAHYGLGRVPRVALEIGGLALLVRSAWLRRALAAVYRPAVPAALTLVNSEDPVEPGPHDR